MFKKNGFWYMAHDSTILFVFAIKGARLVSTIQYYTANVYFCNAIEYSFPFLSLPRWMAIEVRWMIVRENTFEW